MVATDHTGSGQRSYKTMLACLLPDSGKSNATSHGEEMKLIFKRLVSQLSNQVLLASASEQNLPP